MINWLKDAFSESSDVSMMRLLSFVCVVSACVIACTGLYKGANLSELSILCGTFLTAGISGKVLQKNSEVENEKK